MDLLKDTMREIEGGAVIHRDDDDSAENGAEESGDPRGGVFAPDHDAVTFDDVPGVEFAGEGVSEVEDSGVGEGFGAVSAALADGGFAAACLEIALEELG